MGFFNKISKEISAAKQKVQSLYQRINQEDPDNQRYSFRHIDQKKDLLRSTLKFSTYAPLIVESYIILYGVYVFYTILKTIILAPLQVILGIFNVSVKYLNLFKTRYVTMHSLVIVTVSYILTLNSDIFDISFMYHLIRGQSTVKVYAIIFALQSSEIVLTKLGVFLHTNIKSKLVDKDLPFYKLFPQFIVESVYVFSHAYIIYVDFLIYSVVLNSSLQSFIIFWSVVYLTKMKSAPTFGLEMPKYKSTLTEDSKYRISRLTFLLLFLISQFQINVPSFGYKLFFMIFFQQAFIVLKHLLYLLSSYKGADDTSAITLRNQMYNIMYLELEKPSIDRCVSQNFTVLPFAAFSIKIISVVIYSNWQPNFTAYFTFYIILCALTGLFLLIIVLLKSVQQMAHKMRKNKLIENPFLNSICIDVIGKIIADQKLKTQEQNNKSQNAKNEKQQSSHQNLRDSDQHSHKNKSNLRLKKTTSFFESLLLHHQILQLKDLKQEKIIDQNKKLEEEDSSLLEIQSQDEDDLPNQQLKKTKQKNNPMIHH